jgi:hypothetical protein
MRYSTNPIPVKRFVHKYIEAGNTLPDYFYRTLHVLLQHHPDTRAMDTSKYQLKFDLPEHIFKNRGFCLSKTNVVVINAVLEGYIYSRFEHEIEANLRRALREKRSFQLTELVNDLQAEFNLGEEDLPYETIRKHLYRRRIEIGGINLKKIKKIFPKSVPHKIAKSDIFGHLMKPREFCRVYAINERTFRRYKSQGLIPIQTLAKVKYVDVSQLPECFKVDHASCNPIK